MAVFNKNTLTQVSGFDNQIIAGELVYNQATYWNLTLDSEGEPVDCQFYSRLILTSLKALLEVKSDLLLTQSSHRQSSRFPFVNDV